MVDSCSPSVSDRHKWRKRAVGSDGTFANVDVEYDSGGQDLTRRVSTRLSIFAEKV